jgi:hypothetical protein
MGGKKKLGLKQMEKQQDDKAVEDKKKKEKEEKKGPPQKKNTIGVIAPDAKDPKIVAEIKKLGVLTPYTGFNTIRHTHQRSKRLPRTTRSRWCSPDRLS